MNAQLADRFNALGAQQDTQPLDTQPLDTPQGAPSCAPRDTPPLDAPQGTPQGAPSCAPLDAPQGTPQGAPLDAPQGTPQGAPLDAPQGTPQGAPSGAQQGALQWNWFQAPRLAIPHNLPPYYLHDFGEPPSWRFIIAFLCAERYKEMQARKTRTKVEVLSTLSLAIYRQQDAPTAPTGLAGELCTLPIELIQIVAEKMMDKDSRDRADAGV